MIQNRAPLSQKHFDCLDGLRAILALYVVVHHAWLGVFIHNPMGVSYCYFPLVFGRYAVCFFIILSGFCLMLPTLKNDFTLANGTWAFIKRRAWRILPPYYFALIVSVLMDLPVNDITENGWNMILPVTAHNLFTHVLLVHNFFGEDIYKINGALWSIAIEWQVYFFFPLLLLTWRLWGPVYATGAAVVVSILLEYQLGLRFDVQPCSHFVGLFTLGMLAAHFGTSARYKAVPWRLLALVFFAGFAVSLHFDNQPMMDLMFGFFGASLLAIMFARPQGWLHRGLDWKPLVFLGSFSYSIYLVHAPILQLLWLSTFASLQNRPNVWILVLIFLGTPLVVAFSYLFFRFCEQPFLKIRNRKIIHVQ